MDRPRKLNEGQVFGSFHNRVSKTSVIVRSRYFEPEGDSTFEDAIDLYEAAASGRIQIIKRNRIAHVDATNHKSETLLYLAAANGHSEIVRYLLERGAQPKVRNSRGQTALMAAAMGGHANVIKILCNGSYDPGINLDDYNGRTALHHTSHKTWKCLLNLKNKIELEAVDCEWNTPLHVTASKSHTFYRYEFGLQKKFVTALLKRGVDVNGRNWKGRTPLMEASIRRNHAIVSILLKPKYKANINIRDYIGKTALMHAVEREGWTTVELLLAAGADVNCYDLRGFTAVHAVLSVPKSLRFAEISKYLIDNEPTPIVRRLTQTGKMIELLTKNGDYNFQSRDFCGRSAADLQTLGSLAGNRIMHRNGVTEDVNTLKEVIHALTDDRGNTFLHRLCKEEEGLREFFLSRCNSMTHGSTLDLKELVNLTNDRGRTALHCAAMHSMDRNMLLYINWLVGACADKFCRDVYGRISAEYSVNTLVYKFLCQNDDEKYSKHTNQVAGLRRQDISGYELAKRLFKAKSYHLLLLATIRKKNLLKNFAVDYYQPNFAYVIWQNGDYAFRKEETPTICEQVTKFVKKLLQFVAKREPLFQSRLEMVGSAREQTKINELDELDFDAILEILGDVCQVVEPTGVPKGYTQIVKRSRDKSFRNQSVESLDKFFSDDGFLLTDEVNSRFQICIQQVLADTKFWENERSFDLQYDNFSDACETLSRPPRVCATLKLKVNLEDGNQHVFKDISVDIVPCMHLDNWWPKQAIPCRNSEEIRIGCNFVFDQPQRRYLGAPYSPPYARISFAPLESKIVADSPAVARAAYMVAKQIVQKPKHSYILKTCLLYCLEAFSEKIESCSEEVTESDLNFWVRKLLKCYLLFSLRDFFPCYFIPEFQLSFSDHTKSNRELLRILGVSKGNGLKILRRVTKSRSSTRGNEGYCAKICNAVDEVLDAYRVYWSVCDDKTEVRFSLPGQKGSYYKHFQRNELLRKIRSKIFDDDTKTSNNNTYKNKQHYVTHRIR